MGIPNFAKWLGKRYPMIITPCDSSIISRFDNLYLDMNHIIHICSHRNDDVGLKRLTESTKLEIFENIASYINLIYHLAKPTKNFFLGVDGVAPRAKMIQQRSRRYMKKCENKDSDNSDEEKEVDECEGEEEEEDLDKLKQEKDENLKMFHPNCITPGTEFMYELDIFLRNLVYNQKLSKRWNCENIIYSGSCVPGEGERKIMNFIRDRKSSSIAEPNETHIVFGHDADLILLALASHEPYFVILKETRQSIQDMRSSPPLPIPDFEFIQISLLRDYLEMEFRYEQHPENKFKVIDIFTTFDFSIERVIDDFVFITFLLGNDFLPQVPTCDIYYGAIQELIYHYKRTVPKKMNGYLVDISNNDNVIRWDRFLLFLEEMGEIEETIFWRKVDRETNFPHESFQILFDKKFPFVQKEEDDDDEEEITTTTTEKKRRNRKEVLHYDEKIRKKKNKEMFIEWKKDYDFRRFNNDKKNMVAREYLKGLEWNLRYYYSNSCNWKWAFHYYYAPVHSDMAYELKRMIIIKQQQQQQNPFIRLFEFEKNSKPFTPFQQLLAVLPPHSSYLLPKLYRFFFYDHEHSPLIKYFPEKVEMDFTDKRFVTDTLIILPFINEDVLREAEKKFIDSSKFSNLEKKRNEEEGKVLFYFKTTEQEVKVEERERIGIGPSIPCSPCPVPNTRMPGKDVGCRIDFPSFFFFPPRVVQVKNLIHNPSINPEAISKLFIDGKSLIKNQQQEQQEQTFVEYVNQNLKVGDHVFSPLPYPIEGIIEEILEGDQITEGEKWFYRTKYQKMLNIQYGIKFCRYRVSDRIAKIRILHHGKRKNISGNNEVKYERTRSSMMYKYPPALLIKYDPQKYYNTSKLLVESPSVEMKLLKIGSKVVPLRGIHFGWIGTIKEICRDEKKFIVSFPPKKYQQQQQQENDHYYYDIELIRRLLSSSENEIVLLPYSVRLAWTFILLDGTYPIEEEEEEEEEEINSKSISNLQKLKCQEFVKKEYDSMNIPQRSLYFILSHFFINSNNKSKSRGYDIGLKLFSQIYSTKVNGYIRSLIQPIKSYYTRNAYKFSMSLLAIEMVKNLEIQFPQFFTFIRNVHDCKKRVSCIDIFSSLSSINKEEEEEELCEEKVQNIVDFIENENEIKPNNQIYSRIPCGYNLLLKSEIEEIKKHLKHNILSVLKKKMKEEEEEEIYNFDEGMILHDLYNDKLPMNWSFMRYVDIGHLVVFVGEPQKYIQTEFISSTTKENNNKDFFLEKGISGLVTGILGFKIRVLFFRIVINNNKQTRTTEEDEDDREEDNKLIFLEMFMDREDLIDVSDQCVMKEDCDLISQSVKEFYVKVYSSSDQK